MKLATRSARFSCSCSATRSPSIQMNEAFAGAEHVRRTSGGRASASFGDGHKDPGEVDRPSRLVVKPRARTAQL